MIDGYLEAHHADVRVVEEGEGVVRIRITQPLLHAMEDATGGAGEQGIALRVRTRKGFLRATTDGERAYENGELDILNASHPLVRTAALSLKDVLEQPQARVGSVRLRAGHLEDGDSFPPGTYFLAVFPLELETPSNRSESKRLLEVIALSAAGGEALGAEAAERLLHLCLEHGEQPPDPRALPAMSEESWSAMRTEARRRLRSRQQREDQDASSMYTRRKQRLVDERDRKLYSARQRLMTLEERGRSDKMASLARAQIDSIEVKFARKLRTLDGQGPCEASMERDPATCCCVVIE